MSICDTKTTCASSAAASERTSSRKNSLPVLEVMPELMTRISSAVCSLRAVLEASCASVASRWVISWRSCAFAFCKARLLASRRFWCSRRSSSAPARREKILRISKSTSFQSRSRESSTARWPVTRAFSSQSGIARKLGADPDKPVAVLREHLLDIAGEGRDLVVEHALARSAGERVLEHLTQRAVMPVGQGTRLIGLSVDLGDEGGPGSERTRQGADQVLEERRTGLRRDALVQRPQQLQRFKFSHRQRVHLLP